MAPKVYILQVFIKTAAVSGIGLVWVNFIVKAFKMAWHIISISPEEETCEPVPAPFEEFQEPFYDEFIDGLEEKMNIEKIISKDIKHV